MHYDKSRSSAHLEKTTVIGKIFPTVRDKFKQLKLYNK